MTEEEIKKQLFDLHLQYMKYTPKQKEELYEDHIKKLKEIRRQLALLKTEQKENETKIK